MYDNQVSVTRIERLRVVKKEEKLEGLLLAFFYQKQRKVRRDFAWTDSPTLSVLGHCVLAEQLKEAEKEKNAVSYSYQPLHCFIVAEVHEELEVIVEADLVK